MSDKDSSMKIMNDARASTGSKDRAPLKWDETLASAGQQWADSKADKNKMEHSDNSARENQGEDLFAAMPEVTFEAAARVWISEKDGQPVEQGFAQYAHYTQPVWPSTIKVGMASAKGKDGWEYICARFPAGEEYDGGVYELNVLYLDVHDHSAYVITTI